MEVLLLNYFWKIISDSDVHFFSNLNLFLLFKFPMHRHCTSTFVLTHGKVLNALPLLVLMYDTPNSHLLTQNKIKKKKKNRNIHIQVLRFRSPYVMADEVAHGMNVSQLTGCFKLYNYLQTYSISWYFFVKFAENMTISQNTVL